MDGGERFYGQIERYDAIDSLKSALETVACALVAHTHRRSGKMNQERFENEMGAAIMVEELDQRLEMGIWIFDTHDGTTASCGAGCYDCNPDGPAYSY